jgi:hypothetical protein
MIKASNGDTLGFVIRPRLVAGEVSTGYNFVSEPETSQAGLCCGLNSPNELIIERPHLVREADVR